MLVNMNEILTKARQENYAVPAVNVDNEHNLRAALKAAENKNSPIIINVTPYANEDIILFGKIAIEMANKCSSLVCLNLDHAKTFEECVLGLRAGFTNIMFDQSFLPYEENVYSVKKFVEVAHAIGVTVEAELGHVGKGVNYSHDGYHALTNVEDAIKFVEETNVDALAIAIGTAHGVYHGKPEIRYQLLREINEAVDIPLVLHGGSGTGDDNLARCARSGISKINLSNDLKRAAIENLTTKDLSGNVVYDMYSLLAEGFQKKIEHYIDLFGCAGT